MLEEQEIIDADFEDIDLTMDNESLKFGTPTVQSPMIDNLFDFDIMKSMFPDTKEAVKKPIEEIDETIKKSKKRKDFLAEMNEEIFSKYDKKKNKYYLEGELAFTVKKSLLRRNIGIDCGFNPSVQIISDSLSTCKHPITDIPVDNPEFMDNFKQGLIKAIDDNDFDIDTLKVAKGCPKREELLLIIDEVKNRNSLKYGEELDDQNEDVKNDKVQSENKSTQQNAVSTDDDEEMLALELLSSSYDDDEKPDFPQLPFLGNKRIEVPSLPVPTDPDNEALALPAPTDPDYDIDRMFEFDDLDLNFDDENTDFERAIEQDFDLEMNELDKLPQNILDRDDHKNELLRSFEEDSRPTPKNDDEPTAPKKRNRLSV
ncbi:hypothetical protein [Moritella viscosa]|uniref:Exodeoxyribonuclease 7 large subunit-Exodeoxyribonuclease VII large subunit n=1 Tax=Moritella viscosa TaxID=80854 RepID=A0ABY1HBS3_9GAMM|nr:hypothetical protein [Moritella viscosa]SGY87192.1 Exodeoxyribonuclease 7 large subunit-Exodeoxyribonuclease VII large subunit [Moritella viscosa]SGY93343.1 Exodeoxyribonuclease 7 large subunit-Exodeoxyribonuclease VII large subunit [Moritella viscosa]SHO28125.1 Exodeoxyribonuclease 7 large subunit-Exodeoxyribonuclease VII large subunit [Moritella viscosa]